MVMARPNPRGYGIAYERNFGNVTLHHPESAGLRGYHRESGDRDFLPFRRAAV